MEKNEEFMYYLFYILNFHGFWPKIPRRVYFHDLVYLLFLYSFDLPFLILVGINFTMYHKGMFVYQTIAVLSILLPCAVGTYFSVCVIEHIIIRLQHLRSLLRSVSEEKVESTRLRKFTHCIKYHVEIMRLIRLLNNAFFPCYSIHFALSSILIGLLSFKIIMYSSVPDCVHLIGWVISMVALCNAGQKLIDEGEAVVNDIYILEWYKESKPYKSCLLIFLNRAQETLKVNVGFIHYYSHDYLKRIAQASYMYTTIAIHGAMLIEGRRNFRN